MDFFSYITIFYIHILSLTYGLTLYIISIFLIIQMSNLSINIFLKTKRTIKNIKNKKSRRYKKHKRKGFGKTSHISETKKIFKFIRIIFHLFTLLQRKYFLY